MDKYQENKYIEKFQKKIEQYKVSMSIPKLLIEKEKMECATKDVDFWNDQIKAQSLISKLNIVNDKLNKFNKLVENFEEINVYIEMVIEDESLRNELDELIFSLDKYINEFEIEVLLSEEYDSNDCIIEIHPGAGGTESQDWAHMLYRMYKRYAEKKKYKIDVIDFQDGEEAGVKSVTLQFSGINAYGHLKCERGIHRLVRISPFDSNSKRHTSFASLDVLPVINNDDIINIKQDELKIDTYRSSGAGGQSVNTTDSAVRITHIPTNTVVTCQNERSQIKNREIAMTILKSRLVEIELKKKAEELAAIKGEQKSIGWGSQIRSYVMHPYSLVKDLRTKHETSQVQKVLDGELDEFIYSYLRKDLKND